MTTRLATLSYRERCKVVADNLAAGLKQLPISDGTVRSLLDGCIQILVSGELPEDENADAEPPRA